MRLTETEERQAAELLAVVRQHVESGRLQRIILSPPLEWGQQDHRIIKTALCMVASRVLLDQL